MRKTSSMSLVHVSLREAYRQLIFIDFAAHFYAVLGV